MALHKKTLGHKRLGIVTVSYKGEYVPPKKGMELERSSLFTLLIIHPERSLDTHERFYPEFF